MEKVNCIIFSLLIITGFVSSIPISNSRTNYYQDIFSPSVSFTLNTPKPSYLNFDIFDKPNVNAPPTYPLFTPNKIDQRAETDGQIEEYNKALAEEAEEKEQQENELSFPDHKKVFAIPKSTHYVNVRRHDYNYKYTV